MSTQNKEIPEKKHEGEAADGLNTKDQESIQEIEEKARASFRVIRLKADNIKRLKAVDFTPGDTNPIVVGGLNAAGKSSLLDSIMMALGGKKNRGDMPVRAGADSGEVLCVLGNPRDPDGKQFHIRLKMKPDGKSELTIKAADGATYPSPQSLLDDLTGGTITLDPSSFFTAKPKDRLRIIQDAMSLDFTDLNKKRKVLYDERTIQNRYVSDRTANLNFLEVPVEDLPESAPDVTVIIEEVDRLKERNKSREDTRQQIQDTRKRFGELRTEIDDLENRIVNLTQQMAARMKEEKELAEHIESAGPEEDEGDLMSRISAAREMEQRISRNNNLKTERKRFEGEIAEAGKKADDLSESIAAIDAKKVSKLEEASDQLPIKNLIIREEGIFYDGIPFDSVSTSDQWMISIGLAIAMNKDARIIPVREASLLDVNNRKILTDLATEHDVQIWEEVVGEGDDCTIIIEDGEIKSNPSGEQRFAPVAGNTAAQTDSI